MFKRMLNEKPIMEIFIEFPSCTLQSFHSPIQPFIHSFMLSVKESISKANNVTLSIYSDSMSKTISFPVFI